MNNKEWESLMKAAKISKEAADLYKSFTPGAIGAVSQTAAFISHMQSMNAVKANLCGINPNSATNKLKELSKVGNEAILGKESVMNSAIINALNSARKQAMSMNGIADMLKGVQPSLVGEANKAIVNLIKDVRTNALAGSEITRVSKSIDSNLTVGAYKSVANLLKYMNKNSISFFESAVGTLRPDISKNTLDEAADMFRKMREDKSAFIKSTDINNNNSVSEIKISIDGMDEIVSTLRAVEKSVEEMCEISESDVLTRNEIEHKKELQENQSSEQLLFTENEFNAALEESLNDEEKFKERNSKWSEEKKKQFKLMLKVLSFFIEIFILPYLQQNIGLPATTQVVSCVRELPDKAAKLVGTIQKDIETIIMENTNYYYKVKFIDENGEEKEGYVAKRNLKVNEETEDE